MQRGLIAIVVVSLLVPLSCASPANRDWDRPSAGPPAGAGPTLERQPPALLGLPDPSVATGPGAGGKRGEFTPADGQRNGALFEADWYHTNVSAAGDGAGFTPDFVPPTASLDGLAIALYGFSLPDYAGEPVGLALEWTSAPPEGDAFVALGDWDPGKWDWRAIPSSNELQFGDFSSYIDGEDNCVLAVALIGAGAYTLEQLQLAMLEPPHAAVSAYPALGQAPLPVQFSADDSFDVDGTIELYEWDFDGDGTFDEAGADNYASHVYAAAGNAIVSLRVTDDDGLTSTDGVMVTVTEPEGWRLELPVPEVPLDSAFAAAVVDGKPAVAFSTYNELRYCQAADATGDEWIAWIKVQDEPVAGNSLALAVVDGRPVIACANEDRQGPYYVRAFEEDGISWRPRETVAALADLLTVRLIATGDGLPVVAATVSGAAVNSIQVVLGEDAAGGSWLAPIEVDGGDSGFLDPALALVNGLPALSYRNADGEVVYSHSSGVPDGHDWNDETIVDGLGSFGATCLADVNGRPAVFYRQLPAPTDMLYVRADDAGGATWTNFTTPDPDASPRFDAAVGCIDGLPVVAFSAEAPGGEKDELHFVKALDENGAAWEEAEVVGVFDQVGSIEILELADGRPALVFRGDYDQLLPGLHGEALYFAVPE